MHVKGQFKVSKQSGASGSAKLSSYQKSILDVIYKKTGQTCKHDTYYLNRLNDIYEGNKVFSFNWAAALFGPLWFVYRKMYLCTFVFFLGFIFLFDIGFQEHTLALIWCSFDHVWPGVLGEEYRYWNIVRQFDTLAYCIVYGYAGNICYYSFIGKKSKQNMHNNYSATHSPLFMGLLCSALVLLASGVYYFVMR
jgi:hypothetical protein